MGAACVPASCGIARGRSEPPHTKTDKQAKSAAAKHVSKACRRHYRITYPKRPNSVCNAINVKKGGASGRPYWRQREI